MADVSELIERLKRATGPDRELDLAIGEEFGEANHSGPAHHRPFREWARWYTSSIDAALTLVPPTHEFEIGSAHLAGVYWALVVSSEGNFKGRGKTPAIALCIAALHARLSQEPT